jgi:hypothetical protein
VVGLLASLLLRLAVAATPGSLPPCNTDQIFPRLHDYGALTPGLSLYVDVKADQVGELVPIGPIAMPDRHASRLEWTNLAAWPVLEQAANTVLRIRFTYLDRQIAKVPERLQWRATYRARIEEVCRPTEASSTKQAAPVIIEGERCPLPGSRPLPADAQVSFKAEVTIAREHGCSQSSESVASISNFALALDGDRARLVVETFDGSSFGPSLGAYRAGRNQWTRHDARWRRVYAAALARKGSDLVLHFTSLETSVDRRGGTHYAELQKTAVDRSVTCAPGGLGMGVADAPGSVACGEVLLCQDLLDLAPFPADALEALQPIAKRALVEGRLPLRAGPGIQVRAKNWNGRSTTSFTGGMPQ